MLVLRRKEGQWIDIEHVESGDKMRVRTYDITGGNGETAGRVMLAFEDDVRNFNIQREERLFRGPNNGEEINNRDETPVVPQQ